MRPSVLDPLFADLTGLPGVGAKTAARLARAFGQRCIDLLFVPPVDRIDRRHAPPLAEAEAGTVVTVRVSVMSHLPPRHRKQPYRIVCADDGAELELLFFNGRAGHLQKLLPEGEQRVVSGVLETRGDQLQMVHPDHVVPIEKEGEIKTVEPVRRLTEGISRNLMNRIITNAIDRLPALPEWISAETMTAENWPDWASSLKRIHAPVEANDLQRTSSAYRRLAYDELLAQQLSLAMARHRIRNSGEVRRRRPDAGSLARLVMDRLPFTLTGDQKRVLSEIHADMNADRPMHRLLQGDVGSGKTIVALLAMLETIEFGRQAALMAPTDILVRQHAGSMASLMQDGIAEPVVLTGRETGAIRERIVDRIGTGEAKLLLGTHALFQDSVVFNDLGMVVIDEQHRFGVRQRAALLQKGKRPDFLAMSATPIPRSLALAQYGDMDISRLTEKPANRQPVDTRIISLDRIDELMSGITRLLKGDARLFWVCPSIDQGEDDDDASAEFRYRAMRSAFGTDQVSLIHGRLPSPDKDKALAAFATGRTRMLVSTTVIEVGIDVPEASVMVIERAERFGLSQLHQLRGRIGRGGQAGTCILLYGNPLSELGRSRLEVLRQSNDGFWIAEQDLQFRGAGDLGGLRQAGQTSFRFADLSLHRDLLERANHDARNILSVDPDLESQRGQSLRLLLHVFEKEFDTMHGDPGNR